MRLLSILLSVTISNICLAEEGPKEFYQDQYAKTPMRREVKNEESRTRKTDPKQSIERQETNATTETSRIKEITVLHEEQNQKEERKKEIEIQAISLIVNCKDQKHCEKSLVKFTKLVEKHDLQVGDIYLLGSYDVFLPLRRILMNLTVRGAKTHFNDSKPEHLKQVTSSPTWIVQTNQGTVLLEALSNFSSYFSQSGALLVTLN